MASVAVAASAAAVLHVRNSLQVSSRSQYAPIILLPKVAIALHDSHRSLAVPFGGAAFPRRLLRRQRPSSFSFICSSALSPELKSTLDKVVGSNKVVLFMKGTKEFPQCGFSSTVVQILNLMDVPFETMNILENEMLRQGLKEYSNWPTFPSFTSMGSSLAAATLQLKHTKLENCRKRWRRHCVLNKQFLSPNQSFLSQIRSSDNAASQYGVATSLHFNYMLPFFVDLHVLYQIKRGGNTSSQGSFSSFRLVVLSFRFLDYSLRTSLMDKSPLCIILFLLLTLSVVTSTNAVSEDQFNKSSLGAILWASGKDDSDLLAAVDPDDNYGLGEKEGEMTGGFSSIEGMLQWAIGHSDPEKLKEKASDVQRLSSAEMKKRQLEIQDLMAKLKMPSDAELMKIAITDLNNASISLEDRQRALNELLTLVEPVDNANDLNKLGGLVAVVQQLENSESEIRTTSAWILGKACQNTAVAQNQILELGVLERLMKMVKSASAEEAIKALYAISALIRNNENGQELFYSENGYLMLQDIMSDNSNDVRLQKKAVLLVADLANSYQQETVGSAELLHVGDRLFLKTVIDLAMTNDVDLMEKALLATKSLLLLPSTNALDFKDFCGLEKVLDRIKLQLEELSTELGDYAKEMESLRREVHIIFHRKQEKVSWVPS